MLEHLIVLLYKEVPGMGRRENVTICSVPATDTVKSFHA